MSLVCLGAKQKSHSQGFKGPIKEALRQQMAFFPFRPHKSRAVHFFRHAPDSFALCIQIFADAPESCPLSPAAPVSSSAPTRQSKKQSRQNRPLAVYNPQALDIQNGKSVCACVRAPANFLHFSCGKSALLDHVPLAHMNEAETLQQ